MRDVKFQSEIENKANRGGSIKQPTSFMIKTITKMNWPAYDRKNLPHISMNANGNTTSCDFEKLEASIEILAGWRKLQIVGGYIPDLL